VERLYFTGDGKVKEDKSKVVTHEICILVESDKDYSKSQYKSGQAATPHFGIGGD